MKTISRLSCLVIAGFVYVVVVLANTGFLATDEYWDGITRYLPAQKATVMTLIHAEDVKSPLQILPMHAAAQLAYKLGIESPFNQYRVVIILWGLIGFALSAWAAILLFRDRGELLVKVAILALAFHFAMPGLITRPMFEALAAPWVVLSCAFAVLYDEKKSWRPLLAGVFCASMAFVLRQQTGFGALVFVILPVLHKRWRDLALVAISGLTFFVVSGIPDIFLRGSFHHSLRALADYNFKYGSHYGDQPWHFFLPLIFICLMAPWLMTKYPAGFVKDYFRRYRSLWIVLGFFLLLHSMFSNKFERFLISMIPLMVMLMVPFIAHFIQTWPKHRWRLISMVVVSLLIWFPASFFPAQKNIIDLARFMDVHPEYKVIYNVENSYDWLPDAFVRAPAFESRPIDSAGLAALTLNTCDSILVLNENAVQQNAAVLADRYKFLERFDVNIIEAISYKLNPEHNVRRSPFSVYGCKL
ncbi:MAG: hypothetical protein EOP04_16320 [Proteobacteria bacterium]|nr:MAG: hypothetical protein EOP04_16320 [Pseudomonadota bacterium]